MPIFKSGYSIPDKKSPIKPKGTVKYAWIHDWKIGDCVEVSTEDEASKIDAAVCKYGINGDTGKVSRRKVEENGQTFYRVWRIA